MCESKTCKIQCFLIKCMKNKEVPKGKRFCVKCETKKNKKKTIQAIKKLKNVSTRFIHFFITTIFTVTYKLKFIKMLA